MLNEDFMSFVVGSDQVWRPEFIKKEKDAFFFSFTSPEKNLISYAASFGKEELGIEEELLDYKYRMSLFSKLGVREKSAVKICKNLGLEATQVVDPVFLISKYQWDHLSSDGKCDISNKDVIYYTVDEKNSPLIENFIKQNKDCLLYNNIKNISFNLSIEEWLYSIKKSGFFISDSFHGTCFAIIFNIEFICVNPNIITQTRMKSLLDDLQIKHRLYSSFDEVDLKKIQKLPIDYEKVNNILRALAEKGKFFLVDAILNSKVDVKLKSKIIEKENIRRFYIAKNNKYKLWLKYQKYRLLSKITFSKRRSRYKLKKHASYLEYKEALNILNIMK